MRARRNLSALVIGGATVLTLVNGPRAFGQSPCDLADTTAAAGRLDVAHDLYLGLLKAASPPPCATAGVQRVAGRQTGAQTLVAQARTANELGDKAGATAKLAAALKLDPSSQAAEALLRDVAGDPADPYRGATALLTAHYGDEARTEARRVATDVAPGVPIPPDLRAAHSWTAPFDTFVAFLKTGPISTALVIFVLAGSWFLRRKRKPRVTIEKFTDPSADLPIGVALTDMLIDEIQSNGTGRSLERVSDAAAEPDLQFADVLGDQWKSLGAVLNKLKFPRLITVKGDSFARATEDPKGAEAALTLNVIDRRRVIATKTFRAHRDGMDPTSALLSLLPTAGAWVTWILAHKTNATRKWAPLGTDDWRSWGKFREGMWFYGRRDPETARALFLDAIEADVRNQGAWLNLAALDGRRPECWDIALERLDVVEHCIAPPERHGNALWYRARYLRSVILLERSTAMGGSAGEREDDRTAAREHALDLVHQIAATQAELERAHQRRPRARLRADLAALREAEHDDLEFLLDRTEGIAVALLASILVRSGQLPSIDPQPTGSRAKNLQRLSRLDGGDVRVDHVLALLFGLRSDAQLPGATHYNLACLYARAFGNVPATDTHRRDEYVEAMRRHLRRGVEASPDAAVSARDDDPAFEAVRKDIEANMKLTELLDSLVPAKPDDPPPAEWKRVA